MTQRRMGWGLLVGVVGAIATIGQLPSQANNSAALANVGSPVLHLSDLDAAATAIEGGSVIDAAILAQSVTQVTGVQVNPTETGVAITLETAAGELSPPSTAVVGNALIADIPNATLALPEGDEFQQVSPVEGIALVSVTPNGDGIRVAVTGTDAPPAVEVQSATQGLVLSVVPSTEATTDAAEDSIQIVVTGETDEDSYVETDVTTATRTDTPLRDIPQSIQVIPQEVIEDQQVIRLGDALRNVSGVGTVYDPRGARYIIRGFSSSSVLRDGFRLTNGISGNSGFPELANIEQVEVLKGPAAILFGAAEPGGSVNLITEQPLSDPFYELGLRIGNRELFEPSIDLSGPLTEDERVLYRLNALYRTEDSFRDFENDIERFFIAPIVSIAISDRSLRRTNIASP
ncbi:MAG: TonB-dependent receptor plug domain-containing protein [Thainema sp.]